MTLPVTFHYATGPIALGDIERLPCDYPTGRGPVALIRAAILHGQKHDACHVAVVVVAANEIAILPLDADQMFADDQVAVVSLLSSPN